MARTIEERKLANAECARQSRKRKNEQLTTLQDEVDSYKRRLAEVEHENAILRQSIKQCSTGILVPRMAARPIERTRGSSSMDSRDNNVALRKILDIHMENELERALRGAPVPPIEPSLVVGGTSLAMMFGAGTEATCTNSCPSSPESTAQQPPNIISMVPMALQTPPMATSQPIEAMATSQPIEDNNNNQPIEDSILQYCQPKQWTPADANLKLETKLETEFKPDLNTVAAVSCAFSRCVQPASSAALPIQQPASSAALPSTSVGKYQSSASVFVPIGSEQLLPHLSTQPVAAALLPPPGPPALLQEMALKMPATTLSMPAPNNAIPSANPDGFVAGVGFVAGLLL